MRVLGSVLIVVASVVTVAGCAEEATVVDAYWSANRGDYARAQSHICSEVRDLTVSRDVSGAWDRVTRSRTIKNITVDHMELYNDHNGAVVINISFKDGEYAHEKVFVVKEGDDWKIK